MTRKPTPWRLIQLDTLADKVSVEVFATKTEAMAAINVFAETMGHPQRVCIEDKSTFGIRVFLLIHHGKDPKAEIDTMQEFEGRGGVELVSERFHDAYSEFVREAMGEGAKVAMIPWADATEVHRMSTRCAIDALVKNGTIACGHPVEMEPPRLPLFLLMGPDLFQLRPVGWNGNNEVLGTFARNKVVKAGGLAFGSVATDQIDAQASGVVGSDWKLTAERATKERMQVADAVMCYGDGGEAAGYARDLAQRAGKPVFTLDSDDVDVRRFVDAFKKIPCSRLIE